MTVPDFSIQTAEPMTDEEERDWFQSRGNEMRDRGAARIRAAKYTDCDGAYRILLVEGWKVRPDIEPPAHFDLPPPSDLKVLH